MRYHRPIWTDDLEDLKEQPHPTRALDLLATGILIAVLATALYGVVTLAGSLQ